MQHARRRGWVFFSVLAALRKRKADSILVP